MTKRIIIAGLLALMLAVAACVPTPNLRNERMLNDDFLVSSSEDCTLPCWRGITPGVTAWTDAVIILEDDPTLADPQVQTLQEGQPALGALWKMTDGEDCCQMVSEDGETVSFVVLQLAPNHTLGELIAERGEPTYVIGSAGVEDQALINLLYPDAGLIVGAFVAGEQNGALSESSELVIAYLVTDDRMNLIVNTSSMYGWKGYGPFNSYAPEATEADFIVTPSITLTAPPPA
jgi:hypothetical protein